MCAIFWGEFQLRLWCSTVEGTAPFVSAPAGISPVISRKRDSSSSTATITGPSRAISKRCWPASGNSSAVLQRDWLSLSNKGGLIDTAIASKTAGARFYARDQKERDRVTVFRIPAAAALDAGAIR